MTITGTHGYRAPEVPSPYLNPYPYPYPYPNPNPNPNPDPNPNQVYERDYGKGADWWNVGILIIEVP